MQDKESWAANTGLITLEQGAKVLVHSEEVL